MTVETVEKMILDTGLLHVSVFYGHRAGHGAKAAFVSADFFPEGEEMTPEKVANLFTWFMDQVQPGPYTVRMKSGARGGAGEREILVRKEGAAAAVPAQVMGLQGPSAGGWTEVKAEMEKAFEAKMEKLRIELEMNAQKERIEELEAEVTERRKLSPMLALFGEHLAGHLAGLMGSLQESRPATALAGVAQGPVADDTDLDAQVSAHVNTILENLGGDASLLVLLLQKLASIPPEKIGSLANVSDAKLNMALNFL